jgi:YfiH family protein
MPGRPEILAPDWPAPQGVHAFVTSREMGDAKGESARARLGLLLPSAPVWLRQVHGTLAVDAASTRPGTIPEADASFTSEPNVVCAVMAADCMPVLLAARDASVVGAAHAGWRGLCAGVIERTAEGMRVPGDRLIAYMGPAIGPQAYEVGEEVRDAFLARDPRSASAF